MHQTFLTRTFESPRTRILSVVDVYDALTTARSYKAALLPDDAIRELRDEVARGWKFGEIVEEFISLAANGDFVPLSGADNGRAPSIRRW